MKKVLTLFLCMLFLLLSACGAPDSVPEAPSEIAVTEQTAEPTQTEPVDPYSHLYGTYTNLRGEQVLTLDAEGKATEDGVEGTYVIEGEIMTVTLPKRILELQITDHKGTPRLICGWQYLDYVPEAAAADFAPVTVEVTMDNWTEYFELRESGAFGYVGIVAPETGVPDFELWLKPEYVYKLLDAPNPDDVMPKLNVVCTFQYDALAYSFKVNSSGETEFTFHEKLDYKMQTMVPEPRECELVDFRPMNMTLNDTQCPVYVSGGWYAGRIMSNENDEPVEGTIVYPVNPSLASIQGTITLLP